MTIQVTPELPRKQVAWCNSAPPPEAADVFERRGYKVIPDLSEEDLRSLPYMSGVGAVVFTQSSTKPSLVTRQLTDHLQRLLDLDCRVIVQPFRVGDRSIQNTLENLLPRGRPATDQQGNPPLPYPRVYEPTVGWDEIANFVMENPPGPPPKLTLEIEFEDKLEETQGAVLLIRRAFWECTVVHLSRLDEGRSQGVRVYKACVAKNGIVGPWLQPYFVKIGPRRTIYTEFENYELYVEGCIPFHLGTRVVRHRCCLGATEGIMVGHYVDESESLNQCAFDGRSTAALAGLFDRTLIGWHRSGRREDRPFAGPLLRYFPRTINADRLSRAKQLGATLDLTALRTLFEKCQDAPVLVGRTHGDLHAANVRIRANDAVVIDFYAHRDNQPLILDAATLEASLLVDGFGAAPPTKGRIKKADLKAWFDSVHSLYKGEVLPIDVSPKENPKSKSFWFHSCVGQIRRQAREWAFTSNQYAAALALALLVKAKKDPNVPEPEATRRAAAYVFAERLLVTAFGGSVVPSSGGGA